MIGYVGITLDFKPQAKLIDRKASATEHGLPATLLPGFARDDVERPGEAGGNGPEPTAIADDVEESSSAADAMTKPNCQAVVYTYCPVARREFHYRPSVNACLATALDPMVQLCARGFNRFTSRATCEHSCVFGYRPKDACFDMPLFSDCESRNQLRFPYFAHFSQPVGRVRCLRASAVLVEAAHRCLAGDNRFASLADCAEACAAKASGSDHRDQGT
ncbi:hypothetical protein HPB51_005640 [Rhipicephalus microplus]|uniref:BPTI/Kunitz inhibitor domain-containing protein n=1 Tax=Rhipicephalus microplus TaxID=6941 RepID=A0A9J6EMS4_RHIMP|nr:hypothetical protein HPB51_005640 [Rhipicephalus microplus]